MPGWEYFRKHCVREKLRTRQVSPIVLLLLLMSPCRCQALCESTVVLIGMIATLALPPIRPACHCEWSTLGAPMIQADVSLEPRIMALSSVAVVLCVCVRACDSTCGCMHVCFWLNLGECPCIFIWLWWRFCEHLWKKGSVCKALNACMSVCVCVRACVFYLCT